MAEFQRVEFETGWVRDDGTLNRVALYQIEGIGRYLSIGELVMAVCLERATALEEKIIEKMEASAATTKMLERLTKIQTALVNAQAQGAEYISSNVVSLNEYLPEGDKLTTTEIGADWVSYLVDQAGMSLTPGRQSTYSASQMSDLVADLSSKMDSLNSLGQDELLQLQSYTNKRDEAYNLISNVLKSLNTTLVGNANNL